MKKSILRGITVVMGTVILLVIVSTHSYGGGAATGSVIINNRTIALATILVLRVDEFGYRSWHRIGQISPGGQLTLPNVPAGVSLGVIVGGQERKPFYVYFPRGKAVFVYDIYP